MEHRQADTLGKHKQYNKKHTGQIEGGKKYNKNEKAINN